MNDVVAWFIAPLIAFGCFQFISPMYGTLQNLKGIENKRGKVSAVKYVAQLRYRPHTGRHLEIEGME
jgi:hypothetical protein